MINPVVIYCSGKRRSLCSGVFPSGSLQESLNTPVRAVPVAPCLHLLVQQARLRMLRLGLGRLWMVFKIAWFLLSQARTSHVF